MRKLWVNLSLLPLLSGLAACGSSLSGEETAKAKSLIMSNILCETMVRYRVGTVSVLAISGKRHGNLADTIADATDYDSAEMRKKMDAAFGDDLQELIDSVPRDEYEYHVREMFYGLQDALKNEYGYSYPDCEMVLSMSEAFVDHNRI